MSLGCRMADFKLEREDPSCRCWPSSSVAGCCEAGPEVNAELIRRLRRTATGCVTATSAAASWLIVAIVRVAKASGAMASHLQRRPGKRRMNKLWRHHTVQMHSSKVFDRSEEATSCFVVARLLVACPAKVNKTCLCCLSLPARLVAPPSICASNDWSSCSRLSPPRSRLAPVSCPRCRTGEGDACERCYCFAARAVATRHALLRRWDCSGVGRTTPA